MSKVTKTEKNNPVEALIEQGHQFKALLKPGFLVSDLLQEIIDVTGATYHELAEFLDSSPSHIGRIVRNRTPYMKEEHLAKLVRTFHLPFERVVYANAVGRFSNREMAELRAESTGQPALQIPPLNQGEVRVFSYVKVLPLDWRRAQTLEAQRSLLFQSAIVEDEQIGRRMMPVSGDVIVYVRHDGIHMQAGGVRQHIIQDRAIIEVQLIPPALIRRGDVVFVQFKDAFATTYVYYPGMEGVDEYEEYHPVNKQFPVRVLASRKGVEPPLSEQRTILGRVNRVVDYKLL